MSTIFEKTIMAAGYRAVGEIYRDVEDNYFHLVSFKDLNLKFLTFASAKNREDVVRGGLLLLERVDAAKGSLEFFASIPQFETDGVTAKSEKFLDSITGTLEEKALQYIIWSTGLFTAVDEVKEIASRHLDYWADRPQSLKYEMERFLRPHISQFHEDTYSALDAIYSWGTAPLSLLKRLKDPGAEKFFNKISRIDYRNQTGQYWETKLKDIDSSSDPVMQDSQATTIPFHQGEFRDYLENLTVREFSLLVKNIPLSTSPSTAIKMAEGLIRSHEIEGSVTLARECYEEVSRATKPVEDVEYWMEIYSTLMKNWENGSLIKLVTRYYSELEDQSVNHEETKRIVDCLFGLHLKWITVKSHAGNVADRLLELTGSPRRTLDIIRSVESLDKNPKLDQWNKYLNGWAEYSDSPPALVMELM